MEKQEIKNLKKRYLIWFYKVTKDALDKIERKFTQAEMDRLILKELRKKEDSRIKKLIDDFQDYIAAKEKAGIELKYEGNQLKSEYDFLVLKLAAVEKTVVKEFGKETLKEIKSLYEKEMTERILKSTEH